MLSFSHSCSDADNSCMQAEDKWKNEATLKLQDAEKKDKARVELMNTRISSVCTLNLVP